MGIMKKVRKTKQESKLEGPVVSGFKRNKHCHVKEIFEVLVLGPHH